MGCFKSPDVITALSTSAPELILGVTEDKHQLRYLQNPIPLKLQMTNPGSLPHLWWCKCDYQSGS